MLRNQHPLKKIRKNLIEFNRKPVISTCVEKPWANEEALDPLYEAYGEYWLDWPADWNGDAGDAYGDEI